MENGSSYQTKNKCIYKDVCDLYQGETRMCNDDNEAANYYAVGRPAGCYRDHMEDKKNNSWMYSVIGIAIIFVSNAIGFFYHNPYPCSISGIGCSSFWELLSDTWGSGVQYFGTMIGLAFAILGVMMYLRDNKKK